jgi:hypothetical protein
MSGRQSTAAERCKRHGSQGDKTVRCAKCKGDIPPYAGVKVAELRETYVHHPGQCADAAERAETLRKVAQQAMFAWDCSHVQPGVTEPEICSIAGMGRESADAYLEHFRREHGATVLKPTVAPVRLRKGAAAAPRQAPRVPPFKRTEWETTEHFPTGETGEHGQPLYREVTSRHRGQFWCNAAEANAVVVIEDRRSQGLPNVLTTLYLDASGKLTADWSAARSDRREAGRRERDRKFYAERAAS